MKKKSFIFIVLFFVLVISIGIKASAKSTKMKSYKIIYQLNGGKNHSSNVQIYTYAETVTFYPPTREGYVFKGWYTDSGFTQRIKKSKKALLQGMLRYMPCGS